MRKYTIGRVLAWIIVATGVVLTSFALMLAISSWFSTNPLFGSSIMSLQMLPGALLGIGLALAGYVCHAIFDIAEVQRTKLDLRD